MMYGAIAGDIIGSRFEFDVPNWRRDFDLFTKESEFTDDTVMTIAVAISLIQVNALTDGTEKDYKEWFIRNMQAFGHMFPGAGYGVNFMRWLMTEHPQPYNSFGNGSAMRVSPVGWVFDDLGDTREVAKWSAEVSHNHPEGIKGAEATASAIWLARNGFSKEDIITYVVEEFGYDLSKTVDELIPLHKHNESCMDSVPKALIAFYEGNNFEEVVRNAVAIGGDTDTIAAIAGSIAEAKYEIPEWIIKECDDRLGNLKELVQVIERYFEIGK